MDLGLKRMPVAGRPARQRVLDAVRTYFRLHGRSPSHADIAVLACIAEKRVRGHLHALAREGVLIYEAGQRRSTRLVDRGANLSDDELERACHGRNWQVLKPLPTAAAVVAAFPIPADTSEGGNWGLKLLDDLNDIPGTRDG